MTTDASHRHSLKVTGLSSCSKAELLREQRRIVKAKNPKVGQEWKQSGNKVGTPKVEQEWEQKWREK